MAGIAFKNWLPMLNLCAVVLVPAAVIMSETLGGSSSFSSYDEGKMVWKNFGTCFFGTILVSLLGLPLILLHTSALDHSSFWLWIGSTVVTIAGAIWYWIGRSKAKAEY